MQDQPLRKPGRTVLAIDQGTTSSRALRFAADGTVEASASGELSQSYPSAGWVEQDPEALWQSVLTVLRSVFDDSVTGIGIANQRETILLWERSTGRPLGKALVWQDRRTADFCRELIQDGVEPTVQAKTGLLLDPYFSATKLRWLLDHVEGARPLAEKGDLAAGTVDCFLLYRLTGGRVHATDVTNASRTSLYDITLHRWDEELLALFGIPPQILPSVHDNTHLFGDLDKAVCGRSVPIAGMAGDQQAALIGQRCFSPGLVKSTYGTGCFMLANIGERPTLSRHRLLTTPAYRIEGVTAYAMEGSNFIAGSVIKWLRDRMGLIASAEATAHLAASVPPDHGVHLVPAFVGLGAPHWRTDVRAEIGGLTLDSGPEHIARAALEAIAYQSCDLLDAMTADGIASPQILRIDGGMSANDWFAQYLADITGLEVERPLDPQSTALGAATLARITLGLEDGRKPDSEQRPGRRFSPAEPRSHPKAGLEKWRQAVRKLLTEA